MVVGYDRWMFCTEIATACYSLKQMLIRHHVDESLRYARSAVPQKSNANPTVLIKSYHPSYISMPFVRQKKELINDTHGKYQSLPEIYHSISLCLPLRNGKWVHHSLRRSVQACHRIGTHVDKVMANAGHSYRVIDKADRHAAVVSYKKNASCS